MFRTGEVAKGNWVNGQMNGEIEIDLQGGDKFQGQYLKGLKNGLGLHKFPNGSFIEGTWKDDRLINGKATYAHSSSVYTGTFQDNRKHGQGIMNSP